MNLKSALFFLLIVTLGLGGHMARAQSIIEDANVDARTFENWRVACDGDQPCRMSQTIVQNATSRLILQIKIFKEDAPTALMTFPLGILLSTGWQYDIDGKRKTLQPFEICNIDGCHAGLNLTPQLIRAMKRGKSFNIKFFDAGQNDVTPKISLIGFTKAFEALGEAEK